MVTRIPNRLIGGLKFFLRREKAGRALEEGEPVQKVTDQSGGAKRGGYFKKRDYGT